MPHAMPHAMTDATAQLSIVVTGSAGALGQAVARRFLSAGHRVALLDRQEQRLRALYGTPPNALMLSADVTSGDSVAAAIAQAAQAHGRIDALVHVAGGFEMGEGVHQITRASWDRLMDLNAWSFVNLAQAVVPVMQQQGGGGRIVAVSASGAREGQALKGAYSAAKSALQRLVESLAHEVGGQGIHVNSVAPTTLDTPANRAAMPGADAAAWVPLDVAAQAIEFLATPVGAAVHGQHIQLGRS